MNDIVAAPSPEVLQALDDCRSWVALPDPNGAARVLAAEVERLALAVIELRQREEARDELHADEVVSHEWGVRWIDAPPEEEFEPRDDEQAARRLHGSYLSSTEVVSRKVRYGSWQVQP